MIETSAIAVDRALAPFRNSDCAIQNFLIDESAPFIETDVDIAPCVPGLLCS